MSAKPQIASSAELLPAVDFPAEVTGLPKQDLKLIDGTQPPAAQPPKPADPLAAANTMSEEEKIALFS
jgi:hypothetical protein